MVKMIKENKEKKIERCLKGGFKIYSFIIIAFAIITVMMPNVFAAVDNPINVINNLSDFIFQMTKLIGGIIVGYSVVQIGLSFTSHDPSQRVNGVLFFFGGVIIMCAKPIVNFIAG